MHQMDFDKKQLEGFQPVPAGIYELRLVGFEPKVSTKGDSVNLNPVFAITNNADPELNGQVKKFLFGANSKIPAFIQDMVHALGMEMEDYSSPKPKIPGTWDGDKSKFKADDFSTYVYSGPLLNRVCKVELIEHDYQGKKSNKIRKFFCNVPQCAERFPEISHSDNVAGK